MAALKISWEVLMNVREVDARSWLIKYVKAKHNLPNYDKALRFAKSVNYIDENADVTETGRLLFEFSQFNGDYLSKDQKLL
jgi:hypothetical protein